MSMKIICGTDLHICIMIDKSKKLSPNIEGFTANSKLAHQNYKWMQLQAVRIYLRIEEVSFHSMNSSYHRNKLRENVLQCVRFRKLTLSLLKNHK